MAYAIAATLTDAFGMYFVAGTPTLAGSVFAPPPASGSAPGPLATASSVSPATTITFTSAAVPPAGPSTLLVTAATPPANPVLGDLFRSGGLAALPPSPAPLTIITVPVQSVGAATISGMIGSVVSTPFTMTIPAAIAAVVGVLSGGILIPLTLTVATVTVTLGPGAITIAVTGTLVVRQFIFFKVSHLFAFTATLALAPSSDSSNTARVFAIAPTASTLAATGIPGFVTGPLAPLLAGSLAGSAESAVNSGIPPMVGTALASQGLELTPTAVISALAPTITASGVAVRLVIADLFGPAITAIPGTLAVIMRPAPAFKKTETYTVTVTNAASGAPVAGASVVLRNYTGQGSTLQIVKETTNAQGQATFTVELQTGSIIVGGGKGPPHIITLDPTLDVSAQGFNPFVTTLI